MAPTMRFSAAAAGHAAISGSKAIRSILSLVMTASSLYSSRGLFHAEETAAESRRRGGSASQAPESQNHQCEQVGDHVHQEWRDVDAARLELQLQRLSAAENERADDGPEGVPAGEDHQRDGDEASARGHAFVPGQRDGQRQMGAADP